MQSFEEKSYPYLGNTGNNKYYLIEEDIVLGIPNHNVVEDGQSAKENITFQMNYARNTQGKCGFIIDLSQIKSQTTDARKIYADGMDADLCLGTALIVANPLSRAIGSFFIALSKSKVPTKLVDSTDSGIQWLQTLQNK